MTTTIDVTTLTDSELDRALGAAVLDGTDATKLKTERERRRRASEHAALADAEQQRRQLVADAAERDRLLATLTQQRDDLRAGFVALLGELDVAPDKGALVARAYELGRQAYSLSHDLASVTGNRQRFETRYDVPDQLALHGGRAGEAFMAGIRGRPPVVPTPWSTDIARLRELMPRVSRIVGD